MSLLELLEEFGVKNKELNIQRGRQKVGGWMWNGSLKITLIDGRIFIFNIHQKIDGDVGDLQWKPKEEDLIFYPKRFDSFHEHKVICVNNHYYGVKSKLPIWGKERHKKIEEIKEKIKNDSWKDSPDIHFII